MRDLTVIVPTRNRPHTITEMISTFEETTEANTNLVFAIDDNDPTIGEYILTITNADSNDVDLFVVSPAETMVSALNAAALNVISIDQPFAIGFMGDDHRPRTHGWDVDYLTKLHELKTGIVYGDDKIQGEWLPTQCAMTSDIIKALGWMCYPGLRHLYVDDFWKYLGRDSGCLAYLPETIVEHVHPIRTGKWDDGYVRVNSERMCDADKTTFNWVMSSGTLAECVNKIRGLREQNG